MPRGRQVEAPFPRSSSGAGDASTGENRFFLANCGCVGARGANQFYSWRWGSALVTWHPLWLRMPSSSPFVPVPRSPTCRASPPGAGLGSQRCLLCSDFTAPPPSREPWLLSSVSNEVPTCFSKSRCCPGCSRFFTNLCYEIPGEKGRGSHLLSSSPLKEFPSNIFSNPSLSETKGKAFFATPLINSLFLFFNIWWSSWFKVLGEFKLCGLNKNSWKVENVSAEFLFSL